MKATPFKVEDILHYYQDCPIIIKEGNGWFTDKANIISRSNNGEIEIWGDDAECVPLSDVRFILKTIEDMDEETETEYYELCKKILHKKNPEDDKENMLSTVDSPESFAFTINNHYDCYGLIEKGYAIREKDLPDYLPEIKNLKKGSG